MDRAKKYNLASKKALHSRCPLSPLPADDRDPRWRRLRGLIWRTVSPAILSTGCARTGPATVSARLPPRSASAAQLCSVYSQRVRSAFGRGPGMISAAAHYGSDIEQSEGHGEFLGDRNSREAAQAVYARVIQAAYLGPHQRVRWQRVWDRWRSTQKTDQVVRYALVEVGISSTESAGCVRIGPASAFVRSRARSA